MAADIFANAVSALVGEIEIRTALTPPIRLQAKTLVDDSPSRVGPLLKPTVIIRDPQGGEVFRSSPFGEAPPLLGMAVTAGVVLGLLALGYALGRA
jgi:hypothetical protein